MNATIVKGRDIVYKCTELNTGQVTYTVIYRGEDYPGIYDGESLSSMKKTFDL